MIPPAGRAAAGYVGQEDPVICPIPPLAHLALPFRTARALRALAITDFLDPERNGDVTATLFYVGPSLRVLHEDYAKRHFIDARAPLQGRREVIVNAPAARVWRLLSDVKAWDKNLEPGVHDVHVEQGVVVDAPFTRTNKGARMKARFAVVDQERELCWSGSVFGGAKAVHRYVLEPVSGRATRVTVEESMAGPVLALAFFTNAKLDALLKNCLATLKAASEAAPD